MGPLIILGSSRDRGETWDAIQLVLCGRDVPIVSLNDLTISNYDYDNKNIGDDFVPLVEKMIAHSPIVLATPIYWYAMSASMKTFIDRWTNLLTVRKESGRKLRGKTILVIVSYADHPGGKAGFETPFQQTCDYMGMKYGGCFYYYSGEDRALVQQNAANAAAFTKHMFEGSGG